jgi:hypothetical protein
VNDSAKCFTAYKTTDKELLEVYLKDNIDEYQTGETALDALNVLNLVFQ